MDKFLTRIADVLECDFSAAGTSSGKYERLSPAGIEEIVASRVLRKKDSQEHILREMFREYGAALAENVKLERCSRRTELNEEGFVRFYPFLPHWIDLFIEILAGTRLHPNAATDAGTARLDMVHQSIEMLTSPRTRLLDQPLGTLMSIDKVYDLLQPSVPPEKQKCILEIQQRFDGDYLYHSVAGRVAKAICLMEFVKTDLPRTPKNIAALLVHHVTGTPPVRAVEGTLYHLKEARFVFDTEDDCWSLYDLEDARRAASELDWLRKRVGAVNARPPGWHNNLIQSAKRMLARTLNWYTRPLQEFNASVTTAIQGAVRGLDHLSTNKALLEDLRRNSESMEQLSMDVIALKERLAECEKRSAAYPAARASEMEWSPDWRSQEGDHWPACVRTTYVLGLFGTGRRYINQLLQGNLGERAKYFRDNIRLHPGPTPMIYSGHATIKYLSRDQAPPAVMTGIAAALRSGYANSIYVYRHPLDSLLTNWVWWRTYLRDNEWISGISQVYQEPCELCAELDKNFAEFRAFAQGDPAFYAAQPGPRFLSFAEFVEETELHLQAATLPLRLEDFMQDPQKEFSKILRLIPVEGGRTDFSVPPPKSKPYGHLAVQERLPRFQDFVAGLDGPTKARMERIGYRLR